VKEQIIKGMRNRCKVSKHILYINRKERKRLNQKKKERKKKKTNKEKKKKRKKVKKFSIPKSDKNILFSFLNRSFNSFSQKN